MEVIRITFIVYEWNKSYIWKFEILEFHRSVPPLFCDFIISYIFAFFNWHFNRSFQKFFVEQGELSATFEKHIYTANFLWYNENVGACLQTSPIFLIIGNCAKPTLPFCIVEYKLNRDRRATISGDSPLFMKLTHIPDRRYQDPIRRGIYGQKNKQHLRRKCHEKTK